MTKAFFVSRYFFLYLTLVLELYLARATSCKNTHLAHLFETEFVQVNTPIVIWHGMGDTCCEGLVNFKRFINYHLPNAYIKILRLGNSTTEDFHNGFFADANKMVKLACDIISRDSELSDGYNAIGFSQGAQFLRAVAQRCPYPRMKKLISLGGQHQGVYGLPKCHYQFVCKMMRRIISFFAYFELFQRNFIQLSYWHDPNNEYVYRQYNLFLADINQEKAYNLDYKKNLLNLEAFVMVKFLQDTMVVPVESQWFGFYKNYNDNDEIMTMEESDLFLQDKLGLQTLANSGRLHKLSVDNNHLQFSNEWFIRQIIMPFLRDNKTLALYYM